MIRFYTKETDFRLPAKWRVAAWLREVVEGEGKKLGAVNVIFCGGERHLAINRQFLGHDYHTDVITFDYCAGGVVSGDIFIDPEVAQDNAKELMVSPAVEIRRVMVHGVLHLCGYGDKRVSEQKRMRAREDFWLKKFYEKV